ncbi:MAG: major capsid protein, partial [Anaerolineales bacterium]|nr:major capsid protein [Anaerolineales bacterium]
MQLVAYGAQDIYLTGNPQITFFKVVYRRHTNFSMESIEQTFNGTADFGRKVTCTVSRNGDLIHRVYLQVALPQVATAASQSFRWLNWLGHVLVKNVEVEIGGQRIDKHYGDWLHIWNELTQTAGHQAGYANMVGNVPRLTQVVTNNGGTPTTTAMCDTTACVPATTLYVPLHFWFCRNPGLALPLIALQYHEVKINLEFRPKDETYLVNEGCCVQNCATNGSPAQSGSCGSACICVPPLEYASLFVDYVYLDTDERRRFAQVSHEYLIEQLQFTGDESVQSTNVKIKLNFNHPCKELVWV